MQVSRTNELESGREYHSIGRIKASSGWRAVNTHGSEMDRVEALWALVSEAREFYADAVIDLSFEVEAIEHPDYEGATLRRIDGARWPLIAVGCFVGLCFAAVTPAISVVSFRLLLERGASALIAAATSSRRYGRTRIPMALWDFIGAAALLIGSLRFFMALTLVAPILGPATRHLYRKVIVRDSAKGSVPEARS